MRLWDDGGAIGIDVMRGNDERKTADPNADGAEDMVGVILAAGRGRRMGSLPTGLPKPALPVLDEPILYHQLQVMQRNKLFIFLAYQKHFRQDFESHLLLHQRSFTMNYPLVFII